MVGVIDSVERSRPSWFNKKICGKKTVVNEVPNNGKDDDGNGYVDDVYGWNFIGVKWRCRN